MFSFIVLHYKNIDTTIECLNCLMKFVDKKTNIIVVDNNTLNKKEESQLKKYTVDIIKLDKNYGYAYANNIGIEYAKRKYDSDFYIVINNDIIIEQEDFLKIIKRDYNKYHFDLMGPFINSSSGESVNPFPVLKSKEEVEVELKKCNKLLKIYKSSILSFLLKIYLNIKHLIVKPEINQNGKSLKKKVALHGCCIIMSKKYINKYEKPFFDKTFLYHEEEFIYQRIINDNLCSIYDPNIMVFHKEDISLKSKNIREAKYFRIKERIKSLKVLLKYI